MSLRRPAAAVTVDGRRLTAAQAALTTITVDVGVGAAHDRAVLCLGAASPARSPTMSPTDWARNARPTRRRDSLTVSARASTTVPHGRRSRAITEPVNTSVTSSP